MQFLEGATVGIDLGTTYSAIAQLDDEGQAELILNADDRPITPSVVHLLGDEGQVMVGPSFERISIEEPDHVVEAVKREMGNKDFYKVYQNKKLTSEFVSALILKKLKQDAEAKNRPDCQRGAHRALLLQRRTPQSDAGFRPHRGAECDRHHQRADGRHAGLRLDERRTRAHRIEGH